MLQTGRRLCAGRHPAAARAPDHRCAPSLAARRAGFKRVILPAANLDGVRAELPPDAPAAIALVPAARVEQVLEHAIDPPLRLAPRL
jgi:hypothetical protein